MAKFIDMQVMLRHIVSMNATSFGAKPPSVPIPAGLPPQQPAARPAVALATTTTTSSQRPGYVRAARPAPGCSNRGQSAAAL